MIIGAHSIIYSTDADADRAFFRDVLKLGNIDMGGGWLIFGLPPAEVAFHPAGENGKQEFYLMCEDIQTLVAACEAAGVEVTPVTTEAWGLLVHVKLPGGGYLGVYQPTHPRPETPGSGGGGGSLSNRPGAKKAAKLPVAKTKKAAKKKAKAAPVKLPKPKKAAKKPAPAKLVKKTKKAGKKR
jgi:hypothetical protein